ncbi:RHS repeat-associated core domain-containing protein [Pseudomonas sp. WJP1]|nr:RHS repeat-associated core domain-containing protein [Pseudomonas sp. WJP1]WCM54608.1 RHS repeat-associated core domain-containing protein [Pseudomonas sp. WJP1]
MSSKSRKTILLATDQQQSVLNALDANQPNPIAYTPYGHRPRENGLLSLIGFNGELPDPLTGHYHLGKGYRQFNPVLMRFNSPDSWSPFGEGGLNAYVYCDGDPRNRLDPTGHKGGFMKWFNRVTGRKAKVKKTAAKVNPVTTTSTQLKPSENISSPASAMTPSVNETSLTNLKKSDSINMRQRLNKLKDKPADSPPSPMPTWPGKTPYDSEFSNSVEFMGPQELNNAGREISGWAPGGERSRMLRTISNEKKFRSLNVVGDPPESNRTIREGEPGYSSN